MHHLLTAISLTGLLLTTTPEPIKIPESHSSQFETFEPSAGLYAADLKGFLVASDDTDEKDRPFLFLMSQDGVLSDKPIPVKGLKKMTDIESLSEDSAGNLYLLSSLSLNKNGKLKPERNWFARASRNGSDIKITDSIELRSLLLTALEDLNLPDLEETMDVESHFVKDNHLYVGLKNPQPKEGKALIVDLGDVDSLFSEEEIAEASIWKTIDFKAISKGADTLSDMVLKGNTLLLTSTTEEGSGNYWHYDLTNDKLSLVEAFKDQKPEGVIPLPQSESVMLLFDQGEENALFAVMPK